MLNSNGYYAMYLRKSRAEEQESGSFETLDHHLQILSELADRYGIKVSKIYKEVVSGDTIEARPEMQKLLKEVKLGIYDGVLVTEISRLARGRTLDQGTVSEAFRNTGTLIITPSKIYDPTDESDETYFDFELFLARQEYKYIRKRMERGKKLSIQNGRFTGGIAPLGYDKDGKGSLVPNQFAPVVVEMFQRFADGETIKSIASDIRNTYQTGMNENSLRMVLRNPCYIGRSHINTKVKKISKDGKPYWMKTAGESIPALWEGIVNQDLWNQVQTKLDNQSARLTTDHTLKNIFAGVLRCEKCGKVMIIARKKTKHGYSYALEHIRYVGNTCKCSRSEYYSVCNEIYKAMKEKLPQLKISGADQERDLTPLYTQLEKAKKAKESLYDSYDMGIYSPEEFIQRRDKWNKQIETIEKQLSKPKKQKVFTISTQDALDLLKNPDKDPVKANAFLRTVCEKITYSRESSDTEPTLTIFW